MDIPAVPFVHNAFYYCWCASVFFFLFLFKYKWISCVFVADVWTRTHITHYRLKSKHALANCFNVVSFFSVSLYPVALCCLLKLWLINNFFFFSAQKIKLIEIDKRKKNEFCLFRLLNCVIYLVYNKCLIFLVDERMYTWVRRACLSAHNSWWQVIREMRHEQLVSITIYIQPKFLIFSKRCYVQRTSI